MLIRPAVCASLMLLEAEDRRTLGVETVPQPLAAGPSLQPVLKRGGVQRERASPRAVAMRVCIEREHRRGWQRAIDVGIVRAAPFADRQQAVVPWRLDSRAVTKAAIKPDDIGVAVGCTGMAASEAEKPWPGPKPPLPIVV